MTFFASIRSLILAGMICLGSSLAQAQISVPEYIKWKDISGKLKKDETNGSGLERDAAGTGAWDADAVSEKYIFGDGYVEWRFQPSEDAMVGLDSSDANSSYTSFQYGFHSKGDGTYDIRVAGNVPAGSPSGSVTSNTVFRLERKGAAVQYFVYQLGQSVEDLAPIYTSDVPSPGRTVGGYILLFSRRQDLRLPIFRSASSRGCFVDLPGDRHRRLYDGKCR